MINIAICDDEKYISDKVKKLALDFFHRKNVEIKISQFGSGEELLRYNKSIDILFLDIQMDGIDGMETARKLRSQNYKGYLIFITVLKEMVFQAFEVQAYDYLVKPIEEEYFDKKMERLFASMQNANEANLLVQKGYESNIISFDDIIFCEIIDRKIYLHLKSGEVIDYYDRIENLEIVSCGEHIKKYHGRKQDKTTWYEAKCLNCGRIFKRRKVETKLHEHTFCSRQCYIEGRKKRLTP